MAINSSALRSGPPDRARYSIERNRGLVGLFIKKYRGLNLDPQMLESAVWEGLRKTSLAYDPNRGSKFSYYAWKKVSAEVHGALERKLKDYLGSLFLARLALKLGRVERKYLAKNGCYPSDSEAAKILGATEKSVARVRSRRGQEPVYLFSPKGKSPIKMEIDYIPDHSIATPLEELLQREAQAQFEEALRSLPPRQFFVLSSRFGIGEKHEQTLEEVGEMLGTRERGRPFTKENIRLIENQAKEQIRTNFPSLADNL
ncbi:hypothetical protein HZC35_05570 [Candidatus Saganbacteria bacterium]|nr:hypothetical protein [Candidatus Saganbacteria bacterium]